MAKKNVIKGDKFCNELSEQPQKHLVVETSMVSVLGV